MKKISLFYCHVVDVIVQIDLYRGGMDSWLGGDRKNIETHRVQLLDPSWPMARQIVTSQARHETLPNA